MFENTIEYKLPRTGFLLEGACGCVCVCVCECVFLRQRREVICQPIFKYDISTDAYSQPEGASENRFEIKPEVEKLLRKNLIKQPFFSC